MTDAGPTPRPNPWMRLAIAVAAAAICCWRIAAILRVPQFWAEDGAIFFAQAAVDPAHGAGVILSPYAGYLHLIPRLIAIFGTFVPMLTVPLYYNLAAVVSLGLTAWVIQSPRIRLPGACVAALALAAIPHTGEVYGRVCNIQWITALGLFGILLADDAVRPWEKRLDLVGLIATGLTGPFVLLTLPLFVLRVVRRKSRWSLNLMLVAVVTSLLQISQLVANPSDAEDSPPWQFLRLTGTLGRRLIVSLFAGEIPCGMVAATVVLGVTLIALAVALWRGRAVLPGGLELAAASALVVLAATVKIRFDQMPYGDFADGDRYFFTAKVVLVWLLAAMAFRSPPAGRVVLALALACALVANHSRFIFPGQPDMDWPHYAEILQRGDQARVPILPKEFYLWVPRRPSKP